jgi:peptidoglycan/xylan/chitin deacetylase (PgdA/CDA1 family)
VTGWLDPLRAALDARATPVDVFVRDDDAGWADERLDALLAVTDRLGVPIDVAVIPDELDAARATRLAARTTGGLVHLHQHGRAHTNHEPVGSRKCEFGASRSTERLRADVLAGWERLRSLLGNTAEPVFTPPWNRCADELGPILLDAGHRVLSRDRSAGWLDVDGLAEVAVTVDWFAGRWTPDGPPAVAQRDVLAERLGTELAGEGPVGLMLHHGVTDEDELADVAAVLDVLASHPLVRPTSILALAGS